MVEGATGRRRTGLTRAKTIERWTLWLGLPLLLILLGLTAGIVDYTPVRHAPERPPPMPRNDEAGEPAPPMPSISIRPDRLAPLSTPARLGDGLSLEESSGAP